MGYYISVGLINKNKDPVIRDTVDILISELNMKVVELNYSNDVDGFDRFVERNVHNIDFNMFYTKYNVELKFELTYESLIIPVFFNCAKIKGQFNRYSN